MMKLSIMNDFLESNSDTVVRFLKRWGFDKDSVELLRASSNFVFTFKKDGAKFILRITPEADLNILQNEMSFLFYLNEHNISVNKPIASNDGNVVEMIKSPLGTFYAVVFTFFEGQQYEMEEINEEQFYLWGEALGELHHHSKYYSISHYVNEVNSIQGLLRYAAESIPEDEVHAHKELHEIKSWMKKLEITTQNYGRIHFDFELDNLIWDGESVQIIDFEGSLNGWFVADIAFALRDLFPNEVNLSNPLFLQFMKGYKKHMDLTDLEINNISMFLRFQNLITFTKLLDTVDLESNANHPEWLEGLITKLQSRVNDYKIHFKNSK